MYHIFIVACTCKNVRVLMCALKPPVRCQVDGVVSHQTFTSPWSVAGSERKFEVSCAAISGGLDTALLLSRFVERWNRSFRIFSK